MSFGGRRVAEPPAGDGFQVPAYHSRAGDSQSIAEAAATSEEKKAPVASPARKSGIATTVRPIRADRLRRSAW